MVKRILSCFLEFQPLIPKEHGVEALADIIRLSQEFDSESLLCGLKFHSKDDFLLSYSDDAFSLGIDIQLRKRTFQKVEEFQKQLLELTTKKGGKFYLAKDQILPKDFFEVMYPHHTIFKKLKQNRKFFFSYFLFSTFFIYFYWFNIL